MTDQAELFIDSRCELGEGVFWHPLQERLFWFDILNKTLFSATAGGIMVDRFTFDTAVTAAGVIDADNLAIASAAGIYRLELSTDTREIIVPLEADKPGNRSNDGRVDPAGGFWIGTMALRDPGTTPAGSLYQVRSGEVTRILGDVHIPNSTCFSPDGGTAYFTDGVTRTIRKVSIGDDGLPSGHWEDFVHVTDTAEPDGSVVDSEGFIWNAQWNGGRIVRYAPDGRVDRIVTVPVSRPTCPAFGGSDLKTLYITSAREGLSAAELEMQPLAGGVFSIRVDVPGLPENIVKL